MDDTGSMDEMNGSDEVGSGVRAVGTQPPIGGMMRDTREPRTPRSFSGFIGSRIGAGVAALLTGLGLRRPRNDDGTLGPRQWKRLGGVFGSLVIVLVVWTSVHIVGPGKVGVPETLGYTHDAVGPGVHFTLPLTTVHSMSSRTQSYTMSSMKGEGAQKNVDDSVAVLGADGGSAQVNATVLFRLDPDRAVDIYRHVGADYTSKLLRPSARSCIRLEFTKVDMVAAATTSWGSLKKSVTECMKEKIEPSGLLLQDFQLREIALSPQLQKAVDAKVAAQQNAQQQKFELATAQQQADITRVTALATADSQQILACGGKVETIERDGTQVQAVVPNPVSECSQSQLTPEYLQFTYIQALKQLVNSPNNSTIILPFDNNLTPLLNVTPGSTAGTVTRK